MFVSDRLVYLQMQKTASTHIAKVLAAVVGGEQHLQHKRLAIEPNGRLVVASIRNPWAWYVSLWAYGCRGGGGAHGLFHRVTDEAAPFSVVARRSVAHMRSTKRLPISVLRDARSERRERRTIRTDLWSAVYTNPDDVRAFREWLRLMFDPERACELPGQPPRYGDTSLRASGGFMTFRYFTLLAEDRALMAQPEMLDSLQAIRRFDRTHTVHDDMIKIESLEPELLRVLERAGYSLTSAQRDELHDRCHRTTNASPHLRTVDYYDDTSAELVRSREAFLVEKYGYAGPE